jgi:hypothetical protein
MNDIICADAQDWLAQQISIPNVVTGICDMDEMPGYDMDRYLAFFDRVVSLIFSKLQDNCYAIFLLTDRIFKWRLIDKSYIITDIAR